jgi:hypothetical protein
MNTLFFWALPIAAAAHVFEEFAFPGGFKEWYARYRPETATSFTPRRSSVFPTASSTFNHRRRARRNG